MAHSEQVLQRFLAPNFRHRDEPLQAGRAGSRLAGAQIEMHLGVSDGRLQARFRAYGCPATIASADWLAQTLDGRVLESTWPDRHDVIRALELGSARHHCAAIAIEAMQEAFKKLNL